MTNIKKIRLKEDLRFKADKDIQLFIECLDDAKKIANKEIYESWDESDGGDYGVVEIAKILFMQRIKQ